MLITQAAATAALMDDNALLLLSRTLLKTHHQFVDALKDTRLGIDQPSGAFYLFIDASIATKMMLDFQKHCFVNDVAVYQAHHLYARLYFKCVSESELLESAARIKVFIAK